jgi:type IV secretory pathway TrbD component
MTHQTEEFSVLDVGVFLAENWIALVFGPMIIGIAAYVWAASAPQVFTATVSLEVPINLDNGEPMVDPGPLYRVAFAEREDLQTEVVRRGVTFVGRGNSAAGASDLVRTAYAEAATVLIEQLNARIDDARSTMASLAPIIQLIEANLAMDPLSGRELIELSTTISMYEQRIEDASGAIAVLEAEPRSATKRLGMQALYLAVIAWLGAGFALLILLLIRQVFKIAASTDEGRQKLNRVWKAFHIKPRTMA